MAKGERKSPRRPRHTVSGSAWTSNVYANHRLYLVYRVVNAGEVEAPAPTIHALAHFYKNLGHGIGIYFIAKYPLDKLFRLRYSKSMDKQTAGRKGGVATKNNHITLCSLCGSLVKSQFFSETGEKGGQATLQRHGREHYVRAGRMGGRGNKRHGKDMER